VKWNDELGRMWKEPVLRYYLSIFLEGLEKIKKHLSKERCFTSGMTTYRGALQLILTWPMKHCGA
jgi:hypothetical protein